MFIIPSLNPNDKTVVYINELIKCGVKHILLVNDGSKKETEHFFTELKSLDEVTILTHKVNQGKGRALKIASNYILSLKPEHRYDVVTADSDGQHAVKDTIAVAERMVKTNNFTLGIRNFNDKTIPFRSRFGNKCTSYVFKLMFGKWINDTQTGLRGIPHYMLKECMKYEGERYEYEITMLISAARELPIEEVIIDTIYIDDNATSHFNPIKDSWKIYKIMLSSFFGFMLSSMLSSVVDVVSFFVLSNYLLSNISVVTPIVASTIVARIISSIFNYKVNKNIIFKHHSNKGTFVKYFILVIFIMIMSATLVNSVFVLTNVNPTVIKIIIDSILYFVSFYIQKEIVFKIKTNN